MNTAALPRNIATKIRVTKAGCWHWRNAVNSRGYPQVGHSGRVRSVHRVTYELLVGPIPPHLEIDHVCRNKRCVNPRHLEPVTGEENKRRAALPLTRYCPQGHYLNETNSDEQDHPSGLPIRACHQCAQLGPSKREWLTQQHFGDLSANLDALLSGPTGSSDTT